MERQRRLAALCFMEMYSSRPTSYGYQGICWFCGKAGHESGECTELKAMDEDNGGNEEAVTFKLGPKIKVFIFFKNVEILNFLKLFQYFEIIEIIYFNIFCRILKY